MFLVGKRYAKTCAFFHITVTGEGCKDKVDRETKWTTDYSSRKELMGWHSGGRGEEAVLGLRDGSEEESTLFSDQLKGPGTRQR